MKRSFRTLVVYPLLGLLLLLIALIVAMIFDPGLFSQPKPPAKKTLVEAVKEKEMLRCRNFQDDTAILQEAQNMVNSAGECLGIIADASMPDALRKRQFEEMLNMFDDPEANTVEIIQSVNNRVRKKIAVREYLESYLRQKDWQYRIQWNIRSDVKPKIEYTDAGFQCQVEIIQHFERRPKRHADAFRPYEDFTCKIVFLPVRESGNCIDLANKDNSYSTGCCAIKIGNIEAKEIYPANSTLKI